MTGIVLMAMILGGTLTPERRNGAQLARAMRKLNVVGGALYIAAHPDDENTRLLAMLANEMQVRTAYLSLTRGEGGQNLIGRELGPLLGVIRTHELLAARQVDGAEQFFTRARDFGFSKSVEETLATWEHERVLGDVVWVIRSFKPDVIITRFSPDDKDTHGHHTASARIAIEAFAAAADPKSFPEQLTKVSVWQAKRIVWNAWEPDPGEPALSANRVTIDTGLFNPALGASYGEIAAESRSMHKSQGFGSAPQRDSRLEPLVHLAGEPASKTLFDGIDLSWKRIAGSEKGAAALTKAAADFKAATPASALPALLAARAELERLPSSVWQAEHIRSVERLILDCAGLYLEAAASSPDAVAGQSMAVEVTAVQRAGEAFTLEAVELGPVRLTPMAALERSRSWQTKMTVPVPADSKSSTPAWLAKPPRAGTWEAPEFETEKPETRPALMVRFTLRFGATTFEVSRPLVYKWVDPTIGERMRRVEVLPAVTVKPSSSLLGFVDGTPKTLTVALEAHADGQAGLLRLEAPVEFTIEPASAPFQLAKKGQQAEVTFTLRRKSKTGGTSAVSELVAVAQVNEAQFNQTLTRIEYAHIPNQTVLSTASVTLMHVNLRRGKTRTVGYVAGAGDDVPQALTQVGYNVTMLSDEALRSEPLARFHAIVLGIRAFNINARLQALMPRLLQYVKEGGTLVVQYNTLMRQSGPLSEFGPYPFEISRSRVTEQRAAVDFASPVHARLKSPNLLVAGDFENWVQERGLYFAGKWDTRYATPLTMHDAAEPAQQGSLLIGQFGKGTYVYTGLAFFRQLPAGVPGAYRLFANLIEHGQ